MSQLSKEQEYQLARVMQDLFRDSIKACMEGDIAGLEKSISVFLSKHPESNVQEMILEFKSEGKTLVHVAASSGKLDVLNTLLERCQNKKIIVNAADDRGFTPLMNATISESLPIMEKLISLGAEVNARNRDGATAFHFAAGDGNLQRMQLLFQHGAKIDYQSKSGAPIHWAAGKGRSDAIKFLIDQKVDVNARSEDGIPPVIMAAVAACDLGVKYFVDAGADIGMLVSGNLTTLHICAEHGLTHAVESIVRTETGKKCCNVPTEDGNTPIHLASMFDHLEIMKLLLPHSDLPELISYTNDEDKLAFLMKDGKTRLAEWEQKHSSDQHPSTELTAPTSSSVYFDSIACPSITPEIEKEAEEKKEIGNSFLKQAKYAEAVVAYTEAIQLNKFNATYWSNRSSCYLSMKENEKALIDAEICRRVKPDWTKGCYRLAAARLALGLYEDAAVAAFEGCKLDPSNQELKTFLQKAVKLGQEEHKRKQEEHKK